MMKSLAKTREREKKGKKLKKTIYWVAIFVIVTYALFFSKYNIIQYSQTRRTNKQLKQNLTRFAGENEVLVKQIEELRNNPEAWERIAREKYGMQKRGERVIIFRDGTD